MKRSASQSAVFSAVFALAIAAQGATTLYEATPEELSAPARYEFSVTNFTNSWPAKASRLWLEVWCADSGEDLAEVFVRGGKGAKGDKKGFYSHLADLPEKGRRAVSLPYGRIVGALDVAAVSNVVLRTADGEARHFGIVRMVALGDGEAAPAVEEAPRPRVRDTAAHHECYLKFKEECRRGAFVVGQATSMENIRPRAGFKWRDAGDVRVRLARGERESFQILVAPAVHDLKDVTVSIVMEGWNPTDFPSTNITASVVGYVETRDPPPFKIRPDMVDTPRGWWPDPILDFQRSCDISGEDVQSFWVRVACPTNQFAGTYTGHIRVSASNATTVETRLTIRVNDFEVGRVSPLPLAVNCAYPPSRGRKPGDYHDAWKTREEKYCDFFADYYLTTDGLFLGKGMEPRWDMLVRLRDQGRLGTFSLGYCETLGGLNEGNADNEGLLARRKYLHDRYAKAKELGIADHAYVFMCDEMPPSVLPSLGRALTVLRRELPGVQFVTTVKDLLLGTDDSPLKEIAHCPPTCFYMSRPVEKARAEGRKVWWYFCNLPAEPFANATLEGPPIELRSLMGAQTQKFKPDGFLYWQTMSWVSKNPIESGPFTDWNPNSFGNCHGDGQWTCCGGPDLLPLATIRLENFRDGLEDLWYAKLLEQKLREVESGKLKVNDEEWAKRAHEALAVPTDLVRSTMDFSIDPNVLYRWRDKMADLIEATK